MTIWKNEKGHEVRTGHGEDELTASPVERLVIKPCPFCGSEVIIEDVIKSFMPLCSNKTCIASEDGYWAKTKEEALERWNRRAL